MTKASMLWHLPAQPSPDPRTLVEIVRLTLGRANVAGARVLVKSHFGDFGCAVHVAPEDQKLLVAVLKTAGLRPELTDTCTLYCGSRASPTLHVATAAKHGFTEETMGCPIRILGGQYDDDGVEVRLEDAPPRSVYLSQELEPGVPLVVLSAFKGHALFGFSGALKNSGMGLASRRGKMAIHSTTPPTVDRDACTGCGTCEEQCRYGAVSITNGHPEWDYARCVGCGLCIHCCSEGAIKIMWDATPDYAAELLVDHAAAVQRRARQPVLYVNVLTAVMHTCEAHAHNEPPIVAAAGWLLSEDPVALDACSLHLLETEEAHPRWSKKLPAGKRLRTLYPDVVPDRLLAWGEHRGIGTRKFVLRSGLGEKLVDLVTRRLFS